jgi:hypothetical protein
VTRESVYGVHLECNAVAKCRREMGLRASVGCPVHYSGLTTTLLAHVPSRGLFLRGFLPAARQKLSSGPRRLAARGPDVAGLKGEGIAWPVRCG